MPLRITIIGLGRIGASIGLALRQRAPGQFTVIGHDRAPEASKRAQAAGAVDKAEWNLPNAIEHAAIIVLSAPLSALRQTMIDIAPTAPAGCVVTDTAPLKTPASEWARELLPATVHYVGGSPILNPAYLHEAGDTPRADLFAGGLWALISDAATGESALTAVGGLARRVGAEPFYIEPGEFDELMAGVSTVPTLLAAALMRAVGNAEGWKDGRKLADRAFATGTAPIGVVRPDAAVAAALSNSANTLRSLDAVLAQLQSIRKAMVEGDAASLEATLAEAVLLRDEWLTQRRAGNWAAEESPKVDMPSAGQLMRQMIGLGGKK